MQISVNGLVLAFPRQCACCGGQPDTNYPITITKTTGKKKTTTKTTTIPVPYCSICIQHIEVANHTSLSFKILLGLSIVGVMMLCTATSTIMLLGFLMTLVCGGASIYLSIENSKDKKEKLKTLMKPSCQGHNPAVSYTGTQSGADSFDFRSDQYALAFMLANRAKLVNLSPQATKLLNSSSEPVAAIQSTPPLPPPPTVTRPTVSTDMEMRQEPKKESLAQQLKTIEDLRKQGSLSEEEFHAEKKKLLGIN